MARAIGEYERYVSRLSHYVSTDGYDFESVQEEPAFAPKEQYEKWGCEDPRITELEGELFITYVALSRAASAGGGPPRTAVASTRDLRSFRRYGVITPPGADDKDTVLFPEKIQRKYAVLHRPHNWVGTEYGTERPSIWIAYSDDLRSLHGHRVVMKPEQNWESEKIGSGPPPIRTKEGWLLIYHGVDENSVYRAGVAVLDLKDPSRVKSRSPDPILEPEREYERIGDVPDVVFPTGATVVDGNLFVYYGGADKVCCVATAPLEEFLGSLPASEN